MAPKHQAPLLFTMILLLVSCRPDVRVSPLRSPLQSLSAPSPLPSPLQTPSVSERKLMPLPQPAPGTGVIVGVIKVEHTDQPMVGVDLYLAQHIGVTKDTPIYTVEPDSSPHAIVEYDGQFIFKDVPPGCYGIVIWSPLNSFLVRDPVTGLELTVDVHPGQIHNVGTLFAPRP